MNSIRTVYPKTYAHGFVVLCFVVVMQSFIMNSHEVFIHIHQGCFAGTGTIVRLPQCQWSKPDGYGKISQCITTTKHSKAVTVCIFLGIYYKEVIRIIKSSSMYTIQHCCTLLFGLITDHSYQLYYGIFTNYKEPRQRAEHYSPSYQTSKSPVTKKSIPNDWQYCTLWQIL